MADTSHSICLSSCEAAAASVGLAECRWVEEYHVDGFRFDLASCLCRDSTGTPLEVPPIIRDIAKDPVLSKVLSTSVQSALYVATQLCVCSHALQYSAAYSSSCMAPE